jgi:hypothetical protein
MDQWGQQMGRDRQKFKSPKSRHRPKARLRYVDDRGLLDLRMPDLRLEPYDLRLEPYDLRLEPYDLHLEPYDLHLEPYDLPLLYFRIDETDLGGFDPTFLPRTGKDQNPMRAATASCKQPRRK